MSVRETYINDRIRSTVIILIDSAGVNRGQFTRIAAVTMARGEGLDLVQVSNSTPPVCKIADFGKMKFDASKSEKKGHQTQTKEIKFGIDIAQHDLDTKLRKIREFIAKGHRVQLSAELSGRQKFNPNLRQNGRDKMSSVLKVLADVCACSPPKEGEKFITSTLSPI